MDLVKWLQKQKRHHHHRDRSSDIATDDADDIDDIAHKGRQYRSHSVDPSSAHYVNMSLAHHHSGIRQLKLAETVSGVAA